MIKKLFSLPILATLVFPVICFAQSITEFAESLIDPVLSIGKLVRFICLIVGISLLILSVIKYCDYRRGENITLSSVVFLFFVGLALVGIGIFLLPQFQPYL